MSCVIENEVLECFFSRVFGTFVTHKIQSIKMIDELSFEFCIYSCILCKFSCSKRLNSFAEEFLCFSVLVSTVFTELNKI